MKKIALFLLVLTLFLCASEKVVATVAGEKITTDDLQRKFETLPAQYVPYYSSAEGKKKLLEQLVQEKLFYLVAKNNELDKNPEVLSAIQKMSEEIVVNFYLQEEVKKIVVNDKEIKDYFNAHKNDYLEQAKVRASHILVDDEAKAQALIKQLDTGADFATLAKENSKCPSAKNGGDLNYFGKDQMVKPFGDVAFALNLKEYTKTPVKTEFGYHVILLTDKKEAVMKEFTQVKGEIRTQILHEKQKAKLNELTTAAKSKYSVSINDGNLAEF